MGIERSHQTHDLPEIRITVRQHDLYRVRCGCGREHVAALPEGVSSAPCSYGVNLRSLVVYLLVYQHVPVGRCVELIGDLTGGTGPSSGFVHSMLARCAAEVRDTVTLIKVLIISADVVGFDETTLRVGPARTKRYVLSASTEHYTALHLGGRDLASFREFRILPAFAGIAVHYYHPAWAQLAGHQACTALYADIAVMPISGWLVLVGGDARVGEVGIITDFRGRRGGGRGAGSGRAGWMVGLFCPGLAA